MSYFKDDTINLWTKWAEDYLAIKSWNNRESIETGAEAWHIAHGCGITQAAYADEKVTDAHIKTALTHIFPNAIFKDKYHY